MIIKLGDNKITIRKSLDGYDFYILSSSDTSKSLKNAVKVFSIHNIRHKIAKEEYSTQEIRIYTDYEDERIYHKYELLNPEYKPSVVLRNGRLYCTRCRCWIPNTANSEMEKEGFTAHSHICGMKSPGEVYEDDIKK